MWPFIRVIPEDQIMQRILDRSSGYAREVINLGTVSNKGIEVALNGTPVVTKSGFKWNTNIVFSSNRNSIKELPDSSVVLQERSCRRRADRCQRRRQNG